MNNFFETTAIRVEQPIGEFFVASIPVRVLLETAYSRRLSAKLSSDGKTYELEGAQRDLHKDNLKRIGLYLNRDEATFPNSIILAANFDKETRDFVEDKSRSWKIVSSSQGDQLRLIIPEAKKLAQIIDGQHRLFGFNYADPSKLDSELVCSVFFGLPEPMQAQIFATINSKQKPVPKSQTYELFGYNIEDEKPEFWGPDKLAVFFTRKLNADTESPLHKRILVSADNEFVLSLPEARKQGRWMVSTATVVDGILKLISSSVDKDLSVLSEKMGIGRNSLREDRSPLRSLYKENNDKLLYAVLLNYIKSCDKQLWSKAGKNSFILKTVGLQATLDILHRHLGTIGLHEKSFSVDFFDRYTRKASKINFADNYFRNASGAGRTVIRNCLEIAMGFKTVDEMKEQDTAEYKRICGIN